MKKILATIGTTAVLTSSLALVGCSFEQDKTEYVKELIDETVESAAYAARIGILSANDNFSPGYSSTHYGSQLVKDVFPDQFSQFQKNNTINNVSTMWDLWAETFDSFKQQTWDWLDTNASKANINFKGSMTPFNSSISDTLDQIAPIFLLLSQNFSPNSASNLAGILKSSSFDSIRSAAAGLAKYMKSDFLTAMGNAFSDDVFTRPNPVTSKSWTYSDILKTASIDISNFLNSITKTPVADNYLTPTDTSDTNLTKMQTSETASFASILENGVNFNITSLLGAHGIPDLLQGLKLLGSYILAFPISYQAKDDTHLFSASVDNDKEHTNVLGKDYTARNINIQKIIQTLWIFFSGDDQNDPNGLNTLKLMNILFDNHPTTFAPLNTFVKPFLLLPGGYTEIKSDQYLGADQVFLPLFKGLVDGAIDYFGTKISPAIVPIVKGLHAPTLIYKLFYDFSVNSQTSFQNGQKGISDFINELNTILNNKFLLPLIKKFFPQITNVMSLLQKTVAHLNNIKLQTGVGIYTSLYNGGLIGNILTFINSPDIQTDLKALGVNIKVAPATISTLPDLKAIFNDKASTFLKLFNTVLPNWLYLLQNSSWNDVIKDIALDFGVKERYGDNTFSGGIIPDQSIAGLFSALGKSAKATADAEGITLPTISGADPTSDSTGAYALKMIPLTNLPGAGPDGAFNLFGLNVNEGNYYPSTVFDNFNNMYDGGNKGMTKLVNGISQITQQITAGMNKNEQVNYLPHMTNSHFNLDMNSIKINRPETGKLDASFNLTFSDVLPQDEAIQKVTTIVYTLNIEFTNIDQSDSRRGVISWLGSRVVK